ncbi:MAG: hypothetical protein LC768_13610 [Acidobacteria bacterium]|nr:hypothetical protein [Acidobacteriota bacterium]MCA1639347.1 hypothetical protein [Acidobacteriota bacterium]
MELKKLIESYEKKPSESPELKAEPERPKLTLEEIKAKGKELKQQIKTLLQTFQNETGTEVRHIRVITSRGEVLDVDIDIQIDWNIDGEIE